MVRPLGIAAILFLTAFGAVAQNASTTLDVERLHIVPDGFVYPSQPSGKVSAKFVCGTSPGGELAPGRYFTALNVANTADAGAQPLVLEMFVIRTNGAGGFAGPILLPAISGLQGLEIDCAQIAVPFKTDLNAELIKGFVRLTAHPTRSAPIDEGRFEAVAVYTSTTKTR